MRKFFLAWFVIFSLFVVMGCETPGQESFNLGQELAKQNRLEEALSMYEDALKKEPDNPEYKAAIAKVKNTLSEKQLGKIKALLAKTPFTYSDARTAYQEAEKAASLAPDNTAAKDLLARVKAELDNLSKKAEAQYNDATKSIEKNDWVNAMKKLKNIDSFYPNYMDVTIKLKTTESEALSYYLKQAEKYKKADDFDNLVKTYSAAIELFPEHPEIKEGLKSAKSKYNPDYYLDIADSHAKKNDWDKAMQLVQKAAILNQPGDERTAKRISTIKQKAAIFYLNQAKGNFTQRKLHQSYANLLKALSYETSLKNEPMTIEFVSSLFAAMLEKAAAYETNGNWGNAYVLYEKIYNLNQEYADVFFKLQAVKEKIKERVVKKIAVMDFTPPAGNSDAGKIVTDSLLAFITSQSSSDIKILARDVLGAILKEIELGQAGLYDIETAKKAGRLKGTDVFIFGSVLNYKVDKNVTEGYKTVNAVVGKKSTPNPAYQMWLFSVKGTPTDEEKKMAPPATLDEDIRETFKYKVGTEKKHSTVGVSFRVVDIEEGEVVITKTIKKTHEVKDDFSEGVDAANIKFDPLEMPSDGEILDKTTQDVVEELAREVLSRFQNLPVQYSNSAALLKKKKEYERAIEKYVDVRVIEEMKNISGPSTENAIKEIEELSQKI